ncbi:hypothetical protein MMC11_002716 [Xylographa trunciseda]|nr:hypothetical protein [Xylographa trunciseda]
MAGSSVGSDIFAIVTLLVVSSFVLLLLRHFLPLRTTPAYLLVPIFLALALPISIILLVPIDLASTSSTSDEASRGIWLPEAVLLVAWRIAYWLTFTLTWFILPLLGQYVDSGYRVPKDRILYSIRSNAQYQLIVLGCGTVGLIYVFLQNGFEGTSVKSLVMALAYCWGLIQAIYLMGHGLVAVPRRLFRDADTSSRLRRTQSHAPKVHERLEDAVIELDELEGQVSQLRKRKTGISRDHQEWIEELVDISSLAPYRLNQTPVRPGPESPVPAVITDRYLADLTRKLDRARHKRLRFHDAWDRLVQQAADIQSIIDAAPSQKLDFGRPLPAMSNMEKITVLSPYLRYLLYSRVTPLVRIFCGSIFAVASVCIVWSEMVKFAFPQLSVISLTVVHHRDAEDGKIGFVGQVIAALWLFYMCFAALASFDDVKVWGNRALVRRNTYGESACWYAGQIAKLTVPLAYNFVTFLPRSIYRETAFHQFLGRLIILTPLGKGFDYFFPIFILIPVCATLFNLYGKVKSVLGYGIVEDDEEESPSGSGTRGWREGRDLIERELSGRSNLESATPLDGRTISPPSDLHTPSAVIGQQAHSNHQGRALGPESVPVGHSSTAREQQRRLPAANPATEEEDESGISGFAHRVRNTIEAAETPDWIPTFAKRPKWMRGAENNNGQSGRADTGRGLGRWFGGRPADGRVRL